MCKRLAIAAFERHRAGCRYGTPAGRGNRQDREYGQQSQQDQVQKRVHVGLSRNPRQDGRWNNVADDSAVPHQPKLHQTEPSRFNAARF